MRLPKAPLLAVFLPMSVASAQDIPVDVTLRPFIGRLVTLEATIDADTLRLIFDTGAGETIVSPEVAARLGCEPSGRSVGYRMSGERVEFPTCADVTLTIGGIAFAHEQVGVWDVQALLPAGVPRVDGVVSLKTLAAHPFTLRLGEGRLTLETRASFAAQTVGMRRLPTRLATGTDGDELTVLARGVVVDTGWFLIDSGNLDVVAAGPHMRAAAPADSTGTWRGTLMLDGLQGVPTTFRTKDIIYDGVLSEAVLRGWVLAFDVPTGGVWAAVVP